MAYRRKQGGLSRSSTFKEEIRRPPELDLIISSSSSTAPSSPLARRSTNANSPSQSHAARLDSFLSSGDFHSSLKDRSKQGSATYDYTSMRSTNEPGGFWGVLARKAKSILDDRSQPNSPTSPKPEKPVTTTFSPSNHQLSPIQVQHHHHHQYESYSKKVDSPTSRNGVDRSFNITSSSLNHIGDTIGNALEEASKKSEDSKETSADDKWRRSAWDDDEEEKDYAEPNKEPTQLKATRHVAIATADKAKQLLRQLKSVKADLAVAKERCSQLEEENKILREKGADHPTPTDDDMIRDQLETLLAEKGVLAHENSVYARENRYLREIVEFHHLSMQDHMLMYLDQVDDNDLLSSFNHPDNIQIDQSHHPVDRSLIN